MHRKVGYDARMKRAATRIRGGEVKERITQLGRPAPSAQLPQIAPIQFLRSRRLALVRPIFVEITFHPKDEVYLVDCPELDVYGQGRDEQEAMDDFKVALEEFYWSLKRDQQKLGPDLARKWEMLKEALREK